eukprot:m.182146 g.182146  ORF g.182146 m.182146 type:complete len:373 (-) comp18455_c0_seq4:91-1209(-)
MAAAAASNGSIRMPENPGAPLRSIRAPPLRPQRQHSAEIHHMLANNLFSAQEQRRHFAEHPEQRIKSFMRRRVAEWMLKTTDTFRSEPYVFAHAMILLDNFLGSTRSCTPEQLQLLGASALLLAGKCVDSFQSTNLSLPTLCASADDSFTVNDLKAMELQLLHSVNWNPLDLRKPHDYMEECLALMYDSPVLVPLLPRIERNTCVYIDISYLDHAMPAYGPETITAAALQFATSAEDAMGLIQPGNTDDGNSILKLGIFSTDTKARFSECVRDLYVLLNTFGLCSLAPQWMDFFDATSNDTARHQDTSGNRSSSSSMSAPLARSAHRDTAGHQETSGNSRDPRSPSDREHPMQHTYATRSAAAMRDAAVRPS